MANRIVGIDLGTYSVKVIVGLAGFRHLTVADFVERVIPAGDDPVEVRAVRVLAEALRERGVHQEIPCSALPGDATSTRVLDFGFSGLKRADLARAVGAELDGVLPHDLEDIVYDFEPLRRDAETRQAAVEDTTETSDEAKEPIVAGTRVLAVAASNERVGEMLSLWSQVALEPPRAILASQTTYARSVSSVPSLAVDDEDAVLVMDHGHTRTNLCVVKHGRTIFARTLSRGGANVTQSIADAWDLPFADAERAKHSDGFVASTGNPPKSSAWARISDVLTDAILPLVRDVRQTISACRAQTGVLPRAAVLCGGGSRLRGLQDFMTEHVGIQFATVESEDSLALIGEHATNMGEHPEVSLVAHGIMLEGATGRPLFNLRQGMFAYRADFGFLRAKAPFVTVAVLLLIALVAGNAYATLYKLRRETAYLETRLESRSKALFGKSVGPAEVLEKLAPKHEKSPLPKSTAFDQLVEISRVMPPTNKVKLDIRELDIRPQKISIDRATTDSTAAIDEIESSLKSISCFSDITRGKVTGTDEKKFSISISTNCM